MIKKQDLYLSDDVICEESIGYMQKCEALNVAPTAVTEMRKIAKAATNHAVKMLLNEMESDTNLGVEIIKAFTEIDKFSEPSSIKNSFRLRRVRTLTKEALKNMVEETE